MKIPSSFCTRTSTSSRNAPTALTIALVVLTCALVACFPTAAAAVDDNNMSMPDDATRSIGTTTNVNSNNSDYNSNGRNLGSGGDRFDFDAFEGLWEASNLWRFDLSLIDVDNALASFQCTKTSNFPGDHCEVTIKLNSIWGCVAYMGFAANTPCRPSTDTYFFELVGKITKSQFDDKSGTLTANLYERNGFTRGDCQASTRTSPDTTPFQLKLNAGKGHRHAKSLSIEVIDSNTGMPFPTSSNCGSQTFYKIAGGFK